MVFKQLTTGMLGSNCYLIGDKGEGVIIDPGADSEDILKLVEDSGLSIKYIILTHAHIDHICSMDDIREKLGAKVAVHKMDAAALSDSRQNVSVLLGMNRTFKNADILLDDGDTLEVGGHELEVIHTPGHTAGGICIKTGNSVFTGDTLFHMSIGRTDFITGNHSSLINSINEKLLKLGDDIIVYSGHGEATTIGYERRNNPFI